MITGEFSEAKKAFEQLANVIKSYEQKILFLMDENKKLKDEAYQDSELKALKEQVRKLQEERVTSILLTKQERKYENEVLKRHLLTVHGLDEIPPSAIGGNTLEVLETSIGEWIGVKCPICEKTLEFVNRIAD